MCACECVHLHVCTIVYVCTPYTCVCVYMYVCIRVCVYMHMYSCVYKCMHVCVYERHIGVSVCGKERETERKTKNQHPNEKLLTMRRA